MKPRIIILLCSAAISCVAMAQLNRTTRIEAEVAVVDPLGTPIEGAEVAITFPRYGGSRPYRTETALTDKTGIARLHGEAEMDYVMGVRHEGYYQHREPRRDLSYESVREQYAKGLQRVRIELRPIVNPVVGISRFFEGIRIPEVEREMGFDVEVGDFVPPLGKGKTADFVFVLRGRFDSITDYDQTFEIGTVRPMDGILLFRQRPHPGSAFRYEYEAPLDGYGPSKAWHRQRKGNHATQDDDPNAAYFFRIRSELDENGKVIRALYGIISKDCRFGHDKPGEFAFNFSYLLNTDWNRNMEFDTQKSHERGREGRK